MTRQYRMKARALRQEQTRLNIVEAALELHSTVGPNRTTITAVAKRAGVTRPTVYSYFPDLMSLFMACSARGLSLDPPPDGSMWAAIADPGQRLRSALSEQYAYYRRNEARMTNIMRDMETSPRLKQMNEPMQMYRAWLHSILAEGWTVDADRKRTFDAALEHALDFYAWRSLSSNLEDDEIVGLILNLVRLASGLDSAE